ncbi:MAG: N-acetylmuramoyl-L-alanine amidase, partial [Ruminococcus sp.]|nr:N-acetylmuramoyl-L-alanine amidase [Ruminococcus sp.]
MGFTNSPLVSYTKISPNRTPNRNHAIDTITIHCVVGQCSVETLGNVFAPSSRQASSNYGVGYDGKIGMYCEEKDRSWCTSSASNDHRAITIEVASDTTHPYAVRDVAYEALIKLVADICKRNGIKKLVWSTNKEDRVNHKNGCNMTVHRDYANKSCPGEYLYSRHSDIANKVNALLSAENAPVKEDKPVANNQLYRVQVGAFSVLKNAQNQEKRVKAKGF